MNILHHVPSRRRTVVVGSEGFNFNRAVAAELAAEPGLTTIGVDIREPRSRFARGSFVRIAGTSELFDLLRKLRPDSVLIQTPCSEHPAQIRAAVEAGVPLVVAEKMTAEDVGEAEELAAWLAARPSANVAVYDHYLHLGLVRLARDAGLVGDLTRARVELYESGGVGGEQTRSHRTGMGNFLHHAVALARLFGATDLTAESAAFAKHPAAVIPDTYRALRATGRNGVTVELAAGKYMPAARKVIWLTGTRGTVVIDRARNTLAARGTDRRSFVIRHAPDSGYGPLARALADGQRPPLALTVAEATAIMRLMADAHERAGELAEYPSDLRLLPPRPAPSGVPGWRCRHG